MADEGAADLQCAITDSVSQRVFSLLDETSLGQRIDQPLHIAGGKPQSPRDLPDTQRLGIGCEEVQDRNGAADRLILSAARRGMGHDPKPERRVKPEQRVAARSSMRTAVLDTDSI